MSLPGGQDPRPPLPQYSELWSLCKKSELRESWRSGTLRLKWFNRSDSQYVSSIPPPPRGGCMKSCRSYKTSEKHLWLVLPPGASLDKAGHTWLSHSFSDMRVKSSPKGTMITLWGYKDPAGWGKKKLISWQFFDLSCAYFMSLKVPGNTPKVHFKTPLHSWRAH